MQAEYQNDGIDGGSDTDSADLEDADQAPQSSKRSLSKASLEESGSQFEDDREFQKGEEPGPQHKKARTWVQSWVDVKSIIGNGKLRLHTWVATGPPLLANSEFEEPAFLRNSGSGASRDPSKAVVCPVCGKGFAELSSLRRHAHVHNAPSGSTPGHSDQNAGKDFVCPTCGRCFAELSSLRKHIHVHGSEIDPHGPSIVNQARTGAKAFVCEVCGKDFVEISSLKKHMHVHGERSVQCPVPGCGKYFGDALKLRRHQAVHEDSPMKPFKCPFPRCPKSFAWEANLQSHIKNIHESS